MKLLPFALHLVVQSAFLHGALALDLRQLAPLEPLRLESAGDTSVSQLLFSPDERHLLSLEPGSWPGSRRNPDLVVLRSMSTGLSVWRWAFASDGKVTVSSLRFASASRIEVRLSNDQTILLNAVTGKQLGRVQPSRPTLRQQLLNRLKLKPDELSAVASSQRLNAYARAFAGRVWIVLENSASGRKIGQLEELHGNVTALSFSPDGRQLAAARSDHRISLWNVNTRKKRLNLRGHGIAADRLEWSRDSRRLLSSNKDEILLWNVRNGFDMRRIPSSSGTASAIMDAANQTVTFGTYQGTVRTARLSDGLTVRTIGFRVAYSLFSSDGATLCVVSSDGRLRLYQRTRRGYKQQFEANLRRSVSGLVRLSDGRFVMPSPNFNVRPKMLIYNPVKKTLIGFPLWPPAQEPSPYEFSAIPNSSLVLYDSVLFDANTGASAQPKFQASNGSSVRVDLNRNLFQEPEFGRLTMSTLTSNDSTYRVVWQRRWDTRQEFPFTTSYTPDWSPSGRLLASRFAKNDIIIMDAKTGKTTMTFPAPARDRLNSRIEIVLLMFSPSETVVMARYNDATMRYFGLETRKELPAPPALQTALEAQFTPDGRTLMTTTLEGLQFWGVPGKNVFGK